MGSPRWFVGILLTLCISQIMATPMSLAQPIRAHWVFDYARQEVGYGWLPTVAKDKVRVVLDRSIEFFQKASIPAQLTWSDSPAVVERFLIQAKALVVVVSSPDGGVGAVEIIPRDLPSGGRAEALSSIQQTLTAGKPYVFLLSEPVPKAVPRLTISEASEFKQIVAAWGKLPTKGPVRYALLRDGAYLAVIPKDADTVRLQVIGPFLDRTETLIGEIRFANQIAATKLVQETDALFGALTRSNLVTDGLKSYELAWHYQLQSSLLSSALTLGIAEDVRLFRTGLGLASERKGTTTVTVSASKGNGAVVKFAKLPDAERGLFTDFGVTTAVRDIESAKYEFHTYREGRDTGKSIWSCTGDAVWVPIMESP